MSHTNLSLFSFINLTLWACTSCSSGPYYPETFQSKMERYQAKSNSEGRPPSIPLPQQAVQRRTPASLVVSAGLPRYPRHKDQVKRIHALSNRQLYYLTLLHQSHIFQNLLRPAATPGRSICPQFHSTQLRFTPSSQVTKTSSGPWGRLTDKVDQALQKLGQSKAKDHALYPEFYLEDDLGPWFKRAQMNSSGKARKELFSKVFSLHLKSLEKEIERLCERGKGPNYHIFQNLISQGGQGSPEDFPLQLQVLMKTRLFINMALIHSIDLHLGYRSAELPPPYQTSLYFLLKNEVLTRLKAQSSLKYFRTLSSRPK